MWVITRVIIPAILLFIAFPAHASVVFPSVLDVDAVQGEPQTIEINVKNTQATENTYSIEIIGVELGQEEGDYSFYNLDEEKKSWFSINASEFSLISNEERAVEINLSPNQTAKSEVLVVGVQIIEEPIVEDRISVRTGIMTLLFITVGNDIQYDVDWTDFQTSESLFTGEISSYLTLKNANIGVLQPDGVIQTEDIFGRLIDEAILNPELKRIPEGQVRTLVVDQQLPWAIGPYNVNLYVTPWPGAEVFVTTQTIWLCSWRSLLVVIITIIILLLAKRYARRS